MFSYRRILREELIVAVECFCHRRIQHLVSDILETGFASRTIILLKDTTKHW